MKKIWMLAIVFGLISSSLLYVLLFSNNDHTGMVDETIVQTELIELEQEVDISDVVMENFPDSIKSFEISEGKRAISIEISEVQGVTGFISTGDYVDVISILQPPHGGAVTSEILLQNIKVLAISGPGFFDEDYEFNRFKTVTLEVLPVEGAQLAYASQEGTITLMLRAENDGSIVYNMPMKNDEVMEGVNSE